MKERQMRILMLGLDNAGKSTVVKKLKGEDSSGVSPTLGFDICTLVYGQYTLNIWDVGGQETIRAYWRNYFEATDAIVWVVDSADSGRLDDCYKELRTVLHEERLAGATLLILANKQDLPGALDADAVANALRLHEEIGRKRHWCVFPSSAVTPVDSVKDERHVQEGTINSGIESGFKWLVDDVSSRIFLLD